MAFPWLLFGVGGAAVIGGAVLYAKSRQPASSGGSACDAICTAAAAQGVPVSACQDGAAYQACKAASGLFDSVSQFFTGPDWTQFDKDNQKLNGPIELALGPLQDRTVAPVSGGAMLHGTVLRFKSGAVPFKGFPGWEKCAPGTHNMLSDGAAITLDAASGKWVPMNPSLAFSGMPGDPTTAGPFTADHLFHMPATVSNPMANLPGALGGVNVAASSAAAKTVAEAAFPLPLTDGSQGYYARGVAFTCPKGTTPQFGVRDQRTNPGPPPCVGPGGLGGLDPHPIDTLLHTTPGGTTTTSGTVRTHTGGAGGGVTVTHTPGGR